MAAGPTSSQPSPPWTRVRACCHMRPFPPGAPEAAENWSSSDPGRPQRLGDRAHVLLTGPQPEVAMMWHAAQAVRCPRFSSPVTSHSYSAGGMLVASQSPGDGDTSASLGPSPSEPLGFPGWQWVCFPRNSTFQECQAGPQGCFCSFPSPHVPAEDSEVTWQPGTFLPRPPCMPEGGLFLGRADG